MMRGRLWHGLRLRGWLKWVRRGRIVIAITVFALAAGLALVLTRAAAPVQSAEVEDAATLSGVDSVADQTASGGHAVKFGNEIAGGIPTGVVAFSGGDSIALRWQSVSDDWHPAKYHVYRDGTEVGKIDIASATAYTYEPLGTLYVDKSIVKGQAYSYTVRAENSSGRLSAPSQAVTSTLSTNTTPVPTVTVNLNGTTGVDAFVQQIRDTIATWYPKEADILVGGSYAVPISITVNVVTSGCTGGTAAWVSGNVFNACATYAQSNPNDRNLPIHEMTHVIQAYTTSGLTKMVVEGMADWMSYSATGRANSKPGLPTTYADGYGPSAYFFSWVIATYNKPQLMQAINLASHQGTVDISTVLKQQTGKTAGQLATQMIGSHISSVGALINGSGKCADLYLGNTASGATIDLHSCYDSAYQQLVYAANPSDTSYGLLKSPSAGYCLTTVGGATTAGSLVVLGTCDFTHDANLWQRTSSGTLVQKSSGRCLRPLNGSTADSVALEIANCDSTTAQKWALPAD